MAQGMIMRRGGGGGGATLNFSVKAYESIISLPSTVAENTIAIITATSIGIVTINGVAPTGALSAGDVWIKSVDASPAAFLAVDTSKIDIGIALSGAYQYSGSVWVSVDAYWYDGSSWINMPIWLYKDGAEFSGITGGWAVFGSGGSIVKNPSNMQISYDSTSNTTGGARTASLIDLTHYATLYFTVTSAPNLSYASRNFCVFSNTDSVLAQFAISTTGTFSVDVSSINQVCRIGFSFTGNAGDNRHRTGTVTITEVWGD